MKKNTRLIGSRTIVLFGAALVGIFILLFQKEDRLKAMFELVQPDRISVLYLQLLVGINPEDSALRLSLARQLAKIGSTNEANLVIAPLISQPGRLGLEARLLALELSLRLYFAKSVDDRAKEQDLNALKNKIAAIAAEPIPVDMFTAIINHSLELGRPDIAANLYLRWARLDTEHYFELLKEAGRWFIAAGTPLQAAEIYNKAYAESSDLEEAKEFALLAINAFRAADKGPFALTFFKDYLQRFPNDAELLDEAIALSLAANEPQQALAWGHLRLSLNPDNPEQISRQVDLAMAAGRLDEALSFSQRLLKIKPDNADYHHREAQITEWTNNPKLALKHWVWLVRTDHANTEAIDSALRLAKGLYEGATVLEILTIVAEQRALSDAELSGLEGAFSDQSHNSEIVAFLKNYLNRYPNELQGWEALAKSQENAGLFAQAIATWTQIGEQFHQPMLAAIHQAELLRRSGQPDVGFALLLPYQAQAGVNNAQFWLLFADLSWELKHIDKALAAYQLLWQSGAGNELAAERLIQLYRDKAQPQDAVKTAQEAYQCFHQPRWLLLAMDAASQFALWDEVRDMLQKAEADKASFETQEMYWLLRAQLHNHDHQPQQAMTDYQQALTVNSKSAVSKEGALWTLLDQQDNQRLASFLQLWQQDAVTTPSLWGVYGLGLSKLGQDEQALPWFKRKAENNRDDYLWLLSYADVLTKTGRVDEAFRIRQYVLFNLRAQYQDYSQNDNLEPTLSAKLLQPAYLALIRDMEGAEAEETIMRKFSKKGLDDPTIREMAIASYLSQENFEAARFWLLRAHAERQQMPVWQRLAVALSSNDQATAEAILIAEGDSLTPIDRVETLKKLNRPDEAVTVLDNYLQSADFFGLTQPGLYQYRNDLALQQSPQLDLAVDFLSLGVLDINQSQARFSWPLSQKGVAFQFRHNHLNSSDNTLILPANDEIDLSVEGKYTLPKNYQIQLNVGGNLQDQQSLVYGSVSVTSKLTDFIDANVRVGFNEISTETGFFRALGAKDKVSLVLSSQLTPQSFLQVGIDGHRYLTRQGSVLGEGYRVNGILGYTLLKAAPTWQVRLQGSLESNHLKDKLPNELKPALPSDYATVETVVSRDYSTLGVGTSFRYDLSEQAIPRQPYFLADGWIGWAWPSNVLAYNGRVGLGMSFFKADVLSVGAFYGNVQGGKANEAYTGIGIQYSMRF